MPQEIDPRLKTVLLSQVFRPAITTWNRLEGRPRSEEFDRSLRAEVRDPLWMLCRQWQFGEFKGEDGGSAIKAKVQLNTSRIDRYAVRLESKGAAGNEPWDLAVPYSDRLPLETEVERETIPEGKLDPNSSNLVLRIQTGRHWLKLLNRADLTDLRQLFIDEFSFAGLAEMEDLEATHLQSDPASWQTLTAVRGRLPDGFKILNKINGKDEEPFDDWVDATVDDENQRGLVKQLGQAFKDWFHRVYSLPQTDVEDAWAPSYLEYQFAVSAPDDAFGRQRTTLVAEQYHHGHLDWYSFDVAPGEQLKDKPGETFGDSRFRQEDPISFLPTPVEFNGMPNVRWWEFEDRRTDFGNIRASTTDIPLLMLAEFGLIYGNDWSVLPYDLEVGTIADIRGIIVTDVFGVRTFIRPAMRKGDSEREAWNMYNLSTFRGRGLPDTRLFLPPAIGKLQESRPVEKVLLTRDEMANMVWGIEEIIPGISGTGVDGFEAATALSRHFLETAPQEEPSLEPNEAKIRYILGTAVPENWIPFIARHKKDTNRQIRLQRAAMPRLTDALPGTRVESRGAILRTGLEQDDKQPYFIHEEEVPRAGALLTRTFQRTRWLDGKVYTWLGRRKQTGRGEGSSGLAFDQVRPKGDL